MERGGKRLKDEEEEEEEEGGEEWDLLPVGGLLLHLLLRQHGVRVQAGSRLHHIHHEVLRPDGGVRRGKESGGRSKRKN